MKCEKKTLFSSIESQKNNIAFHFHLQRFLELVLSAFKRILYYWYHCFTVPYAKTENGISYIKMS